MKVLFFLFLSFSLQATPVEEAMKGLALELKTSVKNNLMEQLEKKGPVKAISFCQANVKDIAKKTAGIKARKYTFGRTSHKLRNPKNLPAEWMKHYLDLFKGKTKDQSPKPFVFYYTDDGKGHYLEPLYVEAQCLLCHGENLAPEVSQKIKALYPKDEAIGFKEGEFRGFVWVSEK